MLKAVTRQASLVDIKIAAINASNLASGKSKISTAYFFDHYASKEDVAVMVMEEDFLNAERELVPSVSAKELEHYRRVREQFEKVEENPDPQGREQSGKVKGKEIQKGFEENQTNESIRPRSNGKGKGKAVDRKGKGKEKAAGSWDEEDKEDDGYFLDERHRGGMVNGSGMGPHRDKGKGQAREVVSGFQEGGAEDDEGLY
jgi:peroxin-6